MAAEVNVGLAARPPVWTAFDQHLGDNQRREELQEKHKRMKSRPAAESASSARHGEPSPSLRLLQKPGREVPSCGRSAVTRSEVVLLEEEKQLSEVKTAKAFPMS